MSSSTRFSCRGAIWDCFLAAALAASIVPFPSELIFAFCVTRLDPVLCVVSATLGNVLGGITLYWMGMLGKVGG